MEQLSTSDTDGPLLPRADADRPQSRTPADHGSEHSSLLLRVLELLKSGERKNLPDAVGQSQSFRPTCSHRFRLDVAFGEAEPLELSLDNADFGKM